MRSILPRALLLSTAVLAAPALTAQAPTRVRGAPYHDASRAFIDLMVPHHQMAIMMSRHAVEASKNDSVRALARRIIAESEREIAEMKGVRRTLLGSDSTPGGMPQMMMQMMEMRHMDDSGSSQGARDSGAARRTMPMRDSARMRDSTHGHQQAGAAAGARGGAMAHGMMGGDIDRMYLTHMIAHHEDGTAIAILAEHGQSALQVKQLARKIRDGQERDLAQMRRLLTTLAAARPGGHSQ